MPGLLSNYCGLGGEGPIQHEVDRICKRHDEEYQVMMDRGEDPYHWWNDADQEMLESMQKLHRRNPTVTSFGEFATHVGGKAFLMGKKLAYPEMVHGAFTDLPAEAPSEPMMQAHRAEGAPRMEQSGEKRKKREEAHEEPAGHGNTPATGTKQAGFIQKYVPCNFPDKLTVKLKFTETWALRSAATAGIPASQAYIIWNMNSPATTLNASQQALRQTAGHRPNQWTNWKAQYGYYRVEQVEYRITVANTTGAIFIETNNPPGAFTGAVSVSDAICSLMPTQNATDITLNSNQNVWEQKECSNVYLQARSPGSTKTMHTFHGTINSEDYDMDPIQTAADETWTAVANNPTQNKLLGLTFAPASPYVTTNLLPEVGAIVYVEMFWTIQFAGYLPALRQAVS